MRSREELWEDLMRVETATCFARSKLRALACLLRETKKASGYDKDNEDDSDKISGMSVILDRIADDIDESFERPKKKEVKSEEHDVQVQH